MEKIISRDKQLTGLAGEFFVAAELAKRNFQVALTIGNAKSIDLFATNQETGKIFEIEVKALGTKPNSFTLPINCLQKNKIFIFVYLNGYDVQPDFYILKGVEIIKDMHHFYGASITTDRQTINYGPLKVHRSAWTKLG